MPGCPTEALPENPKVSALSRPDEIPIGTLCNATAPRRPAEPRRSGAQGADTLREGDMPDDRTTATERCPLR